MSATGGAATSGRVTVTPSDQLMEGYDRKPPQQIEDGVPPYLFVSAQRGA